MPKFVQVRVMRDNSRAGAPSRGFAFVELASHKHARAVIEALNAKPIFGANKMTPHVEFALEDSRLLHKRELRMQARKERGGQSDGAAGAKAGKRGPGKRKRSRSVGSGDKGVDDAAASAGAPQSTEASKKRKQRGPQATSAKSAKSVRAKKRAAPARGASNAKKQKTKKKKKKLPDPSDSFDKLAAKRMKALTK